MGTPDDMAWELEQQVVRTWIRLREHLDAAAKLAESFDALLLAGKWQDAREVALRLHGEYETTRSAARVPLPVLLRTRPDGARLVSDGKPVEAVIGGGGEPLRTPAVVLCPAGTAPLRMVAELEGFAPRAIQIDGRKQAEVEVVLEVVADRRITFQGAVQTGVGVGDGWLAVGLRGGRVGISRTDGSSNHNVEMKGLKAVDSTPVVQNGRVFFTTNENTIECVAVDVSVPVTGWPVTLPGGAATDLTVNEGRVMVVDRDFVVHCWEQSSGAHLWAVSLDSAPSGPPVLERRQVYVGTIDGRVLVIDAADGSVTSVLRSPAGITTRVLTDRGTVYFGCTDGNVRAVEVAEGRVLWTVAVKNSPTDGEMALAANAVVVVDRQGELIALGKSNGERTGQLQLDGLPQRGVKVQGNRALVALRRPKTKTSVAHDVLQAVSIDTMTLQWEYVDQGVAPGLTGVDELVVAWPTAAGEVVLFR